MISEQVSHLCFSTVHSLLLKTQHVLPVISFRPQLLTSLFFSKFPSQVIPKGRQRLALIWALLCKCTPSQSMVLISTSKYICMQISLPSITRDCVVALQYGKAELLGFVFSVCNLHLVTFSSWGSPFQAETCFDWCAEAKGRGPTKRVPKSWVSAVSVWQWIASASCPLIQNKWCGKPGKAQPLDRFFAGDLNPCTWGKMHVSFLHFHLSADRGKPARIRRGHLWPAGQGCTSKSSQASASLPCSKRGELRISVEAILQPASIQVQAIKVVMLLLETLWNACGQRQTWKMLLAFPLTGATFWT